MTGSSYRLRFWGVRGSVPTPSRGQLRYGGNTSCLAAELGGDEHLILDCGTGLRLFGDHVAERPGPQRFHVFLSHYHLDHILGLPFFHPLYRPGNAITFHGSGPDGRTPLDVLGDLMTPPYFPVTLRDAPATLDSVIAAGGPYQAGDVTVRSMLLNHPNGCLAYRLEHGDRRIVYATDHEHGKREVDDELARFAEGADCLIYDAMYPEAEYESLRRGWGHSTWYAGVRTGLTAGVKELVLFHHHPGHSDEDLDRLLEEARKELPSTRIAAEGMELVL